MIRFAQVSDMNRIDELLMQVNHVHAVGRPDMFIDGKRKYTMEQLQELIEHREKTPILVYVNEEGIIEGYMFGKFEQPVDSNILVPNKSLYIDDLCVDEKCRGKHVGKQLLEYTKKFAKEEGCYSVTLNVYNFNEPAMKFYLKNGLVPLKTGMETIL
ncbi:MAG: GNAT family N-acetyltransferase [Erysipelotrichaceae bacterium]|nr:GNAT family N-acetyltransferase [Erysipelotrichaceae bacterium]